MFFCKPLHVCAIGLKTLLPMAILSPTSPSSYLDSGVPQLTPSNKDAPELVTPWPTHNG